MSLPVKEDGVEESRETVEIKGLPDFSSILGCTVQGDDFTHLGALFVRKTACGKSLDQVMMGSRDITVNCPECVAEIEYRANHREAGRKPMGEVTHKG